MADKTAVLQVLQPGQQALNVVLVVLVGLTSKMRAWWASADSCCVPREMRYLKCILSPSDQLAKAHCPTNMA